MFVVRQSKMGEKKKRSDDGEGETPRKKAKKTHDQETPDAKEKGSADKVDLLELCETQRPYAIAIASPLAKSKDAAKIFKLIGKGFHYDCLIIYVQNFESFWFA